MCNDILHWNEKMGKYRNSGKKETINKTQLDEKERKKERKKDWKKDRKKDRKKERKKAYKVCYGTQGQFNIKELYDLK